MFKNRKKGIKKKLVKKLKNFRAKVNRRGTVDETEITHNRRSFQKPKEETPLTELVASIDENYIEFKSEIDTDSKKGRMRARKISTMLGKQLKEFRVLSVDMDR